jgi:hypothetical protein
MHFINFYVPVSKNSRPHIHTLTARTDSDTQRHVKYSSQTSNRWGHQNFKQKFTKNIYKQYQDNTQ